MSRSDPLKLAHLVVGVLGLVLFVGTGQYMDIALDHLVGMPDAPRALYRSAHIYLLFSALLNLCLGAYIVRPRPPGARVLQSVASGLVALPVALFFYGFAVETPPGNVERDLTRIAIYLSLIGVLLHTVAAQAE